MFLYWGGLNHGRVLIHCARVAPATNLCVCWAVTVVPPAGRPEEQDDSENSTIYITGLTETVTIEEMAEFFKHPGPIRVRK